MLGLKLAQLKRDLSVHRCKTVSIYMMHQHDVVVLHAVQLGQRGSV